MAEKDEAQVNTPRGADWEVVSLTASAYAASPGGSIPEVKHEEKSEVIDKDNTETSNALFMSGHFVYPPRQNENAKSEPEMTEIFLNEVEQQLPPTDIQGPSTVPQMNLPPDSMRVELTRLNDQARNLSQQIKRLTERNKWLEDMLRREDLKILSQPIDHLQGDELLLVLKMREEIMKRQVGLSYGFVKLRLTDHRTPDMVSDIAEKWTNLARTGAIEVTFMGFDITTVMFSLQNAQNTYEVKEFVLSQPESYEIKMGDRFFRRPGDPPYDDLLKELHKSKKKRSTSSNDTILKTEL